MLELAELARANTARAARIESEPKSAARRRRQGFRTATRRNDRERQLVQRYAAAAQFERGQREPDEPDLTLALTRARA